MVGHDILRVYVPEGPIEMWIDPKTIDVTLVHRSGITFFFQRPEPGAPWDTMYQRPSTKAEKLQLLKIKSTPAFTARVPNVLITQLGLGRSKFIRGD